MQNHIVIDLETLDTARTAAFISIGAARLNIATGEIVDTFYANVNMQDAKNYGTVSKSTVDWWKSQPEEARAIFKDNPRALKELMYDFSCWINNKDRVYGNGAMFDIGILEHYYETVRTQMPWKFWNVRDVRTVKEFGELYFGFNKETIPFEGTPHNALDDAIHEAKLVYWVHNKIAEAAKCLNQAK